ncbi:MAG: phosphocholine cytidylyltransferase family protein [Alphaproteobacteria bacterium]|nr:phosphocholine cytidylyltransferase family protein [Alphaproteobacteria bacterium]
MTRTTIKKAIVLAAGQGKRLMPLTADRPKCMVPVAGRAVLAHQIDALAAGGITEIVVVVGFAADRVEDALPAMGRPGLAIRTLPNPFYPVSDNLGSCFLARGEMTEPFVLLNGDTLFEPAILERLRASPEAQVTVTINHKAHYDADDMKVSTEGALLRDIGKSLDPEVVDGEAIGLHAFRGEGPRHFADAVARAMMSPTGLKAWYLSVVARLARQGVVNICSIEGLAWGEIDTPDDLAKAEQLPFVAAR